jgi:hypothetical protein
LLVTVFVASLSSVQAQNLLGDTDQIKREVGDLRNEVQNLRDMIRGMRKVIIESGKCPPQQGSELAPQKQEQLPPAEEKPPQPKIAVDDATLTKIICPAVGKFLAEAEGILRSSDSATAQTAMNQAFQNLTNALSGYKGIHRTNKLLDIYEGLAWDTYVAINLRYSVQGNEDFLKALQKHKRKYLETCPKD